jgi:hypothetical protein
MDRGIFWGKTHKEEIERVLGKKIKKGKEVLLHIKKRKRHIESIGHTTK